MNKKKKKKKSKPRPHYSPNIQIYSHINRIEIANR